MKLCSTFIFLILILTGCEPPKVREKFTNARINPDGKSGLFAFKREHYYPGKMGLLTSTPDEYVVNVTIIGSYDIVSGKVRVLHRRDNGSQYVGDDFGIIQIFGSRALISGNDAHYNWLDTNTGAMNPLHLTEELAERNREVGHRYLVDEKGTLILDNTALGQALNYSASRQLWVRRPNGEYEMIVERPAGGAASHGFRDNELYFYADRKCQIYNLDTRTKRLCERQNDMPRMSPEVTIDFQTDMHGSPQPTIGRNVGGKWIREEVRIDTSQLR